jgi:hypothetical protein
MLLLLSMVPMINSLTEDIRLRDLMGCRALLMFQGLTSDQGLLLSDVSDTIDAEVKDGG